MPPAPVQALESTTLLQVTEDARRLARGLLAAGVVPHTAAADALHIGVAAAHGANFLVPWNFRHIANPAMRTRLERACRDAGYEPPVICSPNELLEVRRGDLETRPGDC